MEIQLVPPNIIPFSKISVEPNSYINFLKENRKLISSELWEINVHLNQVSNLPPCNSDNLSDSYCLFTIMETNNSIKSRIINKSLNPIWDDYFRLPIKSVISDVLRIEVNNLDKNGKNNKIGLIDFPIINYEPGLVYYHKCPIIPLPGHSYHPNIELSFQVTPPGIIPFTEINYIPDQLNIRIEESYGFTTKSILKNSKFYFNIKLESDSNEGFSTIEKDQLNDSIKESFSFIITNRNTDKLIIEYKNEADNNKVLAKCILSLSDLKDGITKELNSPMQPIGKIHLFLQLDKKTNEPFSPFALLPLLYCSEEVLGTDISI